MPMELGITEISAVIAAAGLLVGVAYYVLDMRHQSKVRQTDMVMRLYATFGSTEFLKAYQTIMGAEFEDYEDYLKRYSTNADVRLALMSVGTYFEGIGMLVKRKLVSMDLIDDLLNANILSTWEKIKPIAIGMRKRVPQSWEWFEYLYNEMKRREQKLQQSKA
jgi:hypothetical protein